MTLRSSILRGSLGFTVVSVAAFAVWAFAAKWFQTRGGELAMYAACAAVFLGLSGPLLHRLVQGPGSLRRFYTTFVPAFIDYAVVWCLAWFKLGGRFGEWVGSAGGSLAFVVALAVLMKNFKALPMATLVLFILHSAGYFIGGEVYYASAKGALDRLLWGVLYGLGFGAGIGHAYWAMQRGRA